MTPPESLQVMLKSFPSLPASVRRYVTDSSVVAPFHGDINTVVSIDDRYMVRARKITLSGFDDVGGCGNFKASVDFAGRNHFNLHPNNLILENGTSPSGEQIEYLMYDKMPGITVGEYAKSHGSDEVGVMIGRSAHILSQLHRIQTPHFGFFHGQQFGSWGDFIDFWLENQEPYIRKDAILTEKEIGQVRHIFSRDKNVLALPRPSLIHLDLKPENILIGQEGDINCILDWDNARGGDPAADVSYTVERVFRDAGMERYSSLFLQEYRQAAHIPDWEEFMARYHLYSLFYAYKLLPVHASNKKRTAELSGHVRRMIMQLA